MTKGLQTESAIAAANKISPFEFRDYREFLGEWFAHAKKNRPAFSHRAFARKAGFQTSNYMLLVMKGQRNLTEESVSKCLQALQLNKQEQEFFRHLVFFNQSQTHEEKNQYYQKLLQTRKFGQMQPIEKRQYEYYSAWYHPVVRELIAAKEFDGTPEWISHRVYPAVTPTQVGRSIALLEELGFIEKTGERSWKQTETIVSTGQEVKSVTVHTYHKKLLELSLAVMDRLTMQDREVSSVTLGVSRGKIAAIRSKVREFRKEILKMASEDTAPEEVVLLNIQLYPVTKKAEQ